MCILSQTHQGVNTPVKNGCICSIIVSDHVAEDYPLDDLQKDAIALLLFGSTYRHADDGLAATLARCEVGEYLGKPDTLSKFIRQRYIWVSRITGGAQANNLGQIAQSFVAQYLQENLHLPNVEISKGGCLPGVSHTPSSTERLTSFDLVLKRNSVFGTRRRKTRNGKTHSLDAAISGYQKAIPGCDLVLSDGRLL